MSDESLTPDEQQAFDRVFGRTRPIGLQGNWEADLRRALADTGLATTDTEEGRTAPADDNRSSAEVVTLPPPESRPSRPLLQLALRAAVLVVLAGTAIGAWAVATTDRDGTPTAGVEDAAIPIGSARLTVRADRDTVTVNGERLATGVFQDTKPGDVVEVDADGAAVVTAESVVEIEALRAATITVPELSSPITIDLEMGSAIVKLDPAAQAAVTIDVGDRRFITRTADAIFAVCHAPDGASCLVVLRGQVLWFEDGVASEILDPGQGVLAASGSAPETPRCEDRVEQEDALARLRSSDSPLALADIVASWAPCERPAVASMARVVVPEIVIGSPDVTSDTPTAASMRTLEGEADFFIDARAVTNAEYRSWLVASVGDAADTWRRFAPQDWIERAPGGAATQATYASGTDDDAVQGVSFAAASAFCAARSHRLPTEVEWELAAVRGAIEDLTDDAQDWVSDWEEYGPGPDDSDDRQVLRGADDELVADRYHRSFARTDEDAIAGWQLARIRCTADDYPSYETITDSTGSITIDVPTAWTDRLTSVGSDNLPQITVAPVIADGFIGTYDEPGAQITLAQISDDAGVDTDAVLDLLLDQFREPDCTSTGRSDSAFPLPGRTERFEGCGDSDTQIVHTALVDEAQNLTAILRVQVVGSPDEVAVDTIRSSIRLADNIPD